MLLGEADHDAVFVVATEDALGLLAIEGPANLVGQSLLGHAQFRPAGGEAEFDLGLWSSLVHPGIGDTIIAFQHAFNLPGEIPFCVRGGSP